MRRFLPNLPGILLCLMTGLFAAYLGLYTIVRFHHMYASYYDLGIMQQTVYNTYKAIATFDLSRFLEMTNTMGPDQIKRMAIHNDIFLVLLAPLYFIYSGAETLLIVQAVVAAVGSFALYGIVVHIFAKYRYRKILGLVFVCAYFLYPALGRAVIYEFHSVTLATSFLLFMFYFYLKKNYTLSFLFLILSLLTKEQIGLVTACFGGYILVVHGLKKPIMRFGVGVAAVSIVWFVVSVFVIIPYFRGGNHFALSYYDDGFSLLGNAFNDNSYQYLLKLFGPLGFLPLLSPQILLIVLPEFALNLLSNNENMRNILYHYTAVITPWMFIAAVYSMRLLIEKIKMKNIWMYAAVIILICSFYFAYTEGPFPFAKKADTYAFEHTRPEQDDIDSWAQKLKDDTIRVSASSQIAPTFASRRYFYNFSKYYYLADYIVIRLPEVYNYPEKDVLIPVYNQLMKDKRYQKIFDHDGVVVYKKL